MANPTTEKSDVQIKTHKGSCHCGAVKFEADVDLSKGATRCNCTVCTKLATLGVMAKPEGVRVTQGEDSLSYYEFGQKVAKRYFCKHCGAHCFGRGHLEMLGGDFASVNVNVLDDLDVGLLPVMFWDGRHNNWQAGLRPSPWPIDALAAKA